MYIKKFKAGTLVPNHFGLEFEIFHFSYGIFVNEHRSSLILIREWYFYLIMSNFGQQIGFTARNFNKFVLLYRLAWSSQKYCFRPIITLVGFKCSSLTELGNNKIWLIDLSKIWNFYLQLRGWQRICKTEYALWSVVRV